MCKLCPFCDYYYLSFVMSPRYLTRASVFAFSYVPDNVCHTTLFVDPVLLFLSFRVTPTMILSIFFRGLINFSNWVLLSDQVSQLYVIPGSATCVKCFSLQSHWHIFVSHDIVQFTECIPPFRFYFHFLHLVLVLSHHLPEIYVFIDLFDLLPIINIAISNNCIKSFDDRK